MRKYTNKEIEFYRKLYKNQTIDHAIQMKNQMLTTTKLCKQATSIDDILAKLDRIKDESDPDLTEHSQTVHAYQTAYSIYQKLIKEDIREVSVESLFSSEEYIRLPEKAQQMYSGFTMGDLYKNFFREDSSVDAMWWWLVITGLIHDFGKILLEIGVPSWSVVGDTFPLTTMNFDGAVFTADKACHVPLSKQCVLYDVLLSDLIQDNDSTTDTTNYPSSIGFENMLMSYGHDEYLYDVLQCSATKLPAASLYIIRYHSFYPWHQHLAYQELATQQDWYMLPVLRWFQSHDLYSKSDKTAGSHTIIFQKELNNALHHYIPHGLKVF